jgi:hypothetical protein
MNTRQIIAIIVLVVSGASCKKSKTVTPDPVPADSVVTPAYANYMNLTPGNYWIYEEFNLDSVNGTATPLGIFDSCYVEKDTLIAGHKYHKYWSPVYGSGTPATYSADYLVDSFGYTINSSGTIVFSAIDFSTVFRTEYHTNPAAGIIDTITITYQMGFKDYTVTVPAGTFKTSSFRKIYHLPAPTYKYGPTRDVDNMYAENIGLVKATLGFYIGTQALVEKRLLRYHLQ